MAEQGVGDEPGQMNASRCMRLSAAFGSSLSLLAAIALAAGLAEAQAPIPSFSATTENVAGAPDSIHIDLFRWSTDAERDKLVSAWSMAGAAGRGGRGGSVSGGAGRGGRGGRGGSSGASAPDPAADQDLVDDPPAVPVSRPGRGRGGGGEETPRPTPEGTLAAALQQATTVGYLWSSEVAGYAIRYAARLTQPDGVERIILITSRPLGATNDLWKPVGPGAPSTYGFSVIEMRVNAKGEGEGKASLTGKVLPDGAAKVVALEDYNALPVVLKNVRRK
jgi:hypothetical protein